MAQIHALDFAYSAFFWNGNFRGLFFGEMFSTDFWAGIFFSWNFKRNKVGKFPVPGKVIFLRILLEDYVPWVNSVLLM